MQTWAMVFFKAGDAISEGLKRFEERMDKMLAMKALMATRSGTLRAVKSGASF